LENVNNMKVIINYMFQAMFMFAIFMPIFMKGTRDYMFGPYGLLFVFFVFLYIGILKIKKVQ